MDMSENDVAKLFDLIRQLNDKFPVIIDKFQDMIDELRKENRAELLRCQDAYCTPRHRDLEESVREQAAELKVIGRKVYGASAIVGAAVVVAGIILKII